MDGKELKQSSELAGKKQRQDILVLKDWLTLNFPADYPKGKNELFQLEVSNGLITV